MRPSTPSSAPRGNGISAKPGELITATTLRKAYLLLALAWAALIWYLSDQPGLDIPPAFPMQDKLLHLIAYGVLGFLVMGTRRLPFNGVLKKSPARVFQHGVNTFPTLTYWTVCVLCILYGILDEVHQSFVPGRDASVYDVYADVTGALLGAWLFTALPRAVRAGNP